MFKMVRAAIRRVSNASDEHKPARVAAHRSRNMAECHASAGVTNGAHTCGVAEHRRRVRSTALRLVRKSRCTPPVADVTAVAGSDQGPEAGHGKSTEVEAGRSSGQSPLPQIGRVGGEQDRLRTERGAFGNLPAARARRDF